MRERGCVCRRYAGCGGGQRGQPPAGVWVSEPGGACVSVCQRVRVGVCASTLSDPFWSTLPGNNFFFWGGGADCPSFPALSNSKATSLAARSTRGKTLKILGSPSPHHTRHTPTSPKTKAAACPGWTPPPLNTPPMGGCVGCFFFGGGGQPRGSPPRAYPSPRAPPLIHPSPPPPSPMPFPTLPKFLSPFKLRYRL